MMRIVSWLIGLIFLVVFVLFAVSNRDPLTLTLFPLPFALTVPAYLPPLVTLGLGFLWGSAAMWLADGKLRKRLKTERKHSEKLKSALVEERAGHRAGPARLEAASKSPASTAS